MGQSRTVAVRQEKSKLPRSDKDQVRVFVDIYCLWMVHIKEPLLLIGKSSPCGCSGVPLSLSVWYFTICLTPYKMC